MIPGQERLIDNQERFRRANERLHERVRATVQDERRIPFICECADDSCFEAVPLTSPEYLDVRGTDSRFLIVDGHPTVDGEEVVERRGGYAVVDKSTA